MQTLGLELRSRLMHVLDVKGTPVMRMWNIVRLHSKVLSPASEAFRYFSIERGEARPLAHDQGLISQPAS